MTDDINEKVISGMQRRLDACNKYLTELSKGFRSPEKYNTLLDAAMQQIELCCIDMRNLSEKTRPNLSSVYFERGTYSHEEMYGEVSLMDNGWLDIKLNALLPHCKIVGGTQYIYDSINRLLNGFKNNGGDIPYFEKAYMAIVEHCPCDTSGTFDNDNKGFKGVVNALKGRLFNDDNQFELALGLFTILDDEPCCHIYVMPFQDAGDFHYQMFSELL